MFVIVFVAVKILARNRNPAAMAQECEPDARCALHHPGIDSFRKPWAPPR